jgi:ABC-type Fe3+ transport system substrate-binding protein
VDWKELLGDEYETYETYMTDGIIDLSRMSKWEKGGYTSYSPAYLCVLKKSEHLEKARSFLDYFFE